MIRISTSYDSAKAKDYFTESLDRGDYYRNGQEMPGYWGGKVAGMLGLGSKVSKEQFFSLCDNVNPLTGEQLTPRKVVGRRVGYDINFHVPKSLSLLYSLGDDWRILEAFRESVALTMADIEALMQTRVRVNGQNTERDTGNAVWATFIHTTARPVAGFPDPLLHAHCFTFNATHDPAEDRFKAGEFCKIETMLPLLQARYHLRLSERVAALGYEIVEQGKFWEVASLSRKLIEHFSRRSREIDSLAEKLGIADYPERKAELAARTRQQKDKDASAEFLRTSWKEHAGPEFESEIHEAVRKSQEPKRDEKEADAGRERESERESDKEISSKEGGEKTAESASPKLKMPSAGELRKADEFVRFTIEHEFERRSAMRVLEFEASLMTKAIGKVSEAALILAMSKAGLIRRTFRDEVWVTPEHVLKEEQRMLEFERNSRGRFSAMVGEGYKIRDQTLNNQQQTAVHHVLASYDQVMLIRGTSGSGKTTLMTEAISAIKSAGEKVMVVSPYAQVVRSTLPQAGFKDAVTLARLFVDKELQKQLRGSILWVDEAGVIGTRQMCQLFDFAEKHRIRIVLSGDERQHSSVTRGDGIRILVEEGGMRSAEVKTVVRQEGEYKEACEILSRGDVVAAFNKLDSLGFIKQTNGQDAIEKIHTALAGEYGDALKAGKRVTAIAPTREEGTRVNAAIRRVLKEMKVIKDADRNLERLVSLNLTDAEKKRGDSYRVGQVIEFHDATRGRKNGKRSEVLSVIGDQVLITGALGLATPLLLKKSDAAKFSVYQKETIQVAVGDTIRITSNGKSKGDLLGFLPDRRRPLKGGGQLLREIGASVGVTKKAVRHNDKRINNAAEYKILGFVPLSGDVILSNGRILDKNFGHVSHGYCTTSQGSQSKTVHRVLIAMTSMSYGMAMNDKQLYVSATRAKESCTIYTENKAQVLKEVAKKSERVAASTVVREGTETFMENERRYREHMNRGKAEEKDFGRDYDR